ncbi:MAG: hypothetical protein COV36_02565 [Alphaproteobacteria bacterium CG11_big_fil_rev_8_21_14_0_20_44_7]|nr:MAG: hypothetical protein COV36_02565 [Alphaproteobacteria bacterium CG11_big_fil_rev_8_21_14_0_20_44_7]
MNNTQRISAPDFAHYEEILQSSILFRDIKTEIVSEFMSMSSIISYPKNSNIFNIDDKADWFYFIIEGWVKTYRETMDGDEVVIGILGKNEIFGENAIFENFLYPFSADIAENAVLIRLPIGILAKKIEQHPELSINLLRHANAKISISHKENEHHIVQNAPQRIGCFLLNLCDSHTKKQSLNLPFDKTLIALKLGMKPETFSRALTKLKEETGIIVNSRNVEIPSTQILAKFCCGTCSSQYPCSD